MSSLLSIFVLSTLLAIPDDGPTNSTDPNDSNSIVFLAASHGSNASVGSTVLLGRTAPVYLGCSSEPGQHDENSLAALDTDLVSAAFTATRADAILFRGEHRSRTSARLEGVSVLDGLITADLVRAVSESTASDAGFGISGADSKFVNLRVLGVPVGAAPSPNTRIDLPGLGYVILNEQEPHYGQLGWELRVKMIHVFVTNPLNLFGLETGTEIVVSQAWSGLRLSEPGTLAGQAYGSRVAALGSFMSGPSARVVIGCLGGSQTNNVDFVDAAPVLTTGQVVTTADGTTSPMHARTTAEVTSIDVLDGLITADVLRAVATADEASGSKTFSDAGSTITNLRYRGELLLDVQSNTRIQVPALGVLWLHRVVEKDDRLTVRMIDLIVTIANNPYDLPLGTRIEVAHASVGLR